MVEKEEAAVARATTEGVDAVEGRTEMVLAGRRHNRFAVVPATRCRAAIVDGCGMGWCRRGRTRWEPPSMARFGLFSGVDEGTGGELSAGGECT